jgi:hypothetical protein
MVFSLNVNRVKEKFMQNALGLALGNQALLFTIMACSLP